MLSSKNLRTWCPSKKLSHKMQGPFEIKKVVSPNAVILQMLRRSRLHNIFYVSLREPYCISSKACHAPPHPERVRNEADDMDVDVEGLWEIDEIMGSSNDQVGNMKYLTKWVGFPEQENWTEKPLEHFLGLGEEMIRRFHR